MSQGNKQDRGRKRADPDTTDYDPAPTSNVRATPVEKVEDGGDNTHRSVEAAPTKKNCGAIISKLI